MRNSFIFAVGAFSFLLGWAFFYRPGWILRLNRLARERVFNDRYAQLERRRRGVLLLLVSLLFFYWGYQRAQYSWNSATSRLVSNDRLLYQAARQLRAKRYQEAKAICEQVLARNPNNAEALYHLSAAEFLLHDSASSRACWTKAEKLNPAYSYAPNLKRLVAEYKDPAAPTPDYLR